MNNLEQEEKGEFHSHKSSIKTTDDQINVIVVNLYIANNDHFHRYVSWTKLVQNNNNNNYNKFLNLVSSSLEKKFNFC